MKTIFKVLGTLAMLSVSAVAQTSTAQSAMFSNTASGNFVITGSQVYEYDKAAASTYFSNTLSSGPVVTCTGGGAGGVNCLAGNQPVTPSAPAPEDQKLTPVVANNSCNFWEGTLLTVNNQAYEQSVTVNGLNGRGNWKFEWTYAVAVSGSNPPAAKTAWNLQNSGTTAADVTVTGWFAGQSTQKKNNNSGAWSFKASHTMIDDLGASRLVNPVATILAPDASVVCTLSINQALESGVDYVYARNAGSNGPTDQLIDGELVSRIQQGLIASPGGNLDNFAGNNLTNGDRANIASTSPASCSISTAGNYTLSVTGTLKGVSGSSSTPVSVSSNLCISAGSCSLCQ